MQEGCEKTGIPKLYGGKEQMLKQNNRELELSTPCTVFTIDTVRFRASGPRHGDK